MSAITYLEVCLPNHRTVGEIVFMGKPEFVFRNTCALPRFQTRRCVLQSAARNTSSTSGSAAKDSAVSGTHVASAQEKKRFLHVFGNQG